MNQPIDIGCYLADQCRLNKAALVGQETLKLVSVLRVRKDKEAMRFICLSTAVSKIAATAMDAMHDLLEV